MREAGTVLPLVLYPLAKALYVKDSETEKLIS